MFSPEGFVPVYRLWQDIDTLERVLTAAKQRPKIVSAYRCSPWDILEWRMFDYATKMGLYLCSPKLELLKIEDIYSGPNELTAAHLDGNSSIYDKFAHIFKIQKYGAEILDEDFRTQKIPDKVDVGMEAYEFFTDGFLTIDIFRSIPSYYERLTYTVCTSGSQYLFEHDEFKVGGELVEFFRKFEGWSICVTQSAYETEWPLLLSENKPSSSEEQKRGGRPSRESDLAMALIAQKIPSGLEDLTAKEVYRRIGSPPISIKTVQRAVEKTLKRNDTDDNSGN